MKQRNNDMYVGFMEKYPVLFQKKDKPMTETCMCWGIECPEGWFNILSELCKKLEFLNNTLCKNYNVQIVAEQVKEKFGTLRFYYNILPFCEDENLEKTYHIINDIVSDIVNMAEVKSGEICQICGKEIWAEKDKKVSMDWIGYYCSDCVKDYDITTYN